MILTFSKEKQKAINPYQLMEIAITVKTATALNQSGVLAGNVDKNRLPKKAAVLGLEKLVNNPFRKAARVFGLMLSSWFCNEFDILTPLQMVVMPMYIM